MRMPKANDIHTLSRVVDFVDDAIYTKGENGTRIGISRVVQETSATCMDQITKRGNGSPVEVSKVFLSTPSLTALSPKSFDLV